jgi:hypothetical protein
MSGLSPDDGVPNSHAPLSPEADQFLAEALDEFGEKEEALERQWHLSAGTEYGLDQDTCSFWLQLDDGSRWAADAQILGSFDEEDETWQWAWANPNCTAAMARDSRIVRETGKRLGVWYLHELERHPMPGPEFVAYLCAIGMKASGSIGMFEGSEASVVIFIMLKNIRWIDRPVV